MTDRDHFLSAAAIALLGVASVSVTWAIAAACYQLSEINKSLQKIDNTINYRASLHVAQYSWLVAHYAKPVRPLYPWESHKCEWCGSEKKEQDDD